MMKSNCQSNDFIPKSTVEEMLKNQEDQFKIKLQQQYEYFQGILIQLNIENSEKKNIVKNKQYENNDNNKFYSYLNTDLNYLNENTKFSKLESRYKEIKQLETSSIHHISSKNPSKFPSNSDVSSIQNLTPISNNQSDSPSSNFIQCSLLRNSVPNLPKSAPKSISKPQLSSSKAPSKLSKKVKIHMKQHQSQSPSSPPPSNHITSVLSVLLHQNRLSLPSTGHQNNFPFNVCCNSKCIQLTPFSPCLCLTEKYNKCVKGEVVKEYRRRSIDSYMEKMENCKMVNDTVNRGREQRMEGCAFSPKINKKRRLSMEINY